MHVRGMFEHSIPPTHKHLPIYKLHHTTYTHPPVAMAVKVVTVGGSQGRSYNGFQVARNPPPPPSAC